MEPVRQLGEAPQQIKLRLAMIDAQWGDVNPRQARREVCGTIAIRTSAAEASGNADQSSAMLPVTNGTAKLVPLNVISWPLGPRLVMRSPGAMRPRLPTEELRLEVPRWTSALPQAVTGITQEWRVIAEL